MDYDPRSEPHNLAHDPVTSLVVPRPIGWISKTVPLESQNGKRATSSIVIGEVVNVHIDDGVIVDGMTDHHRIRAIARLGCMDYCVVDDIFTMVRV
jgi:hypothetical protein